MEQGNIHSSSSATVNVSEMLESNKSLQRKVDKRAPKARGTTIKNDVKLDIERGPHNFIMPLTTTGAEWPGSISRDNVQLSSAEKLLLQKVYDHIRYQHREKLKYAESLRKVGYDDLSNVIAESMNDYWMRVNAALLHYKILHGNLIIPHNFIVPATITNEGWPKKTVGIMLGSIVGSIRNNPLKVLNFNARQQIFDEEEGRLIKSIKNRFNYKGIMKTNKPFWKDVYAALLHYKQLYGNLKVPHNFIIPVTATDEEWPEHTRGIRLGSISRDNVQLSSAEKLLLRKVYDHIRYQHREKLKYAESLRKVGYDDLSNVIAESMNDYWMRVNAALLHYKILHGNLIIPHNFIIPATITNEEGWPKKTVGIKLGSIVGSIRNNPLKVVDSMDINCSKSIKSSTCDKELIINTDKHSCDEFSCDEFTADNNSDPPYVVHMNIPLTQDTLSISSASVSTGCSNTNSISSDTNIQRTGTELEVGAEDTDNVAGNQANTQIQLHEMRFWELTVEENAQVNIVLLGPDNYDVVIDKFNVEMTRSKMLCLKPHTWLNDEVINFYMNMLKERDEALCAANLARRSSWFFNSFFIAKLLGCDGKYTYTYTNVKRWSKKFDVFAMDKVYMPVNISNTHWTLLVIYVQIKRIHYYDSMSGSGKRYLEAAKRWIVDEAKDKKGINDYDVSDWVLVDREPNVPQQMNGVDCGVFTTVCADFVSDNLPLDYEQDHMPFFRRKIAADILRGSLRYNFL